MTGRARKRRDAWRKTNKLNGTFNTREALKALKSSGFDEKQAESVVETINKAVNETVATKSDLATLAAKMATKEALGTLADKMATKDDIKDMATKADLEVQGAKIDALRETVEGVKENIAKNMATKTDLSNLETRMMRMMWLQLMAMLGMFVTMVVALP